MIPANCISVMIAALLITGLTAGCEQPTEPPEEEEEPNFAPGEYGGDPLEDTEHLYGMRLSRDGSKIALIRSRTPGGVFEPRDQLWIINADGTDPKLIGYDIGTLDWSMDGEKLAVTYMPGAPYTYLFTIHLDSMKARNWSGHENMFFSKKTASNPRWFNDGNRLLVSIWGEAYQQPYKRGLYIFNTQNNSVKGPLVEVAAAGFLGNKNNSAIARKYSDEEEILNGNFIIYEFESESWSWVTKFSQDSLQWIEFPYPNPVGNELVVARHIKNAWQLFFTASESENLQQLTELGGSQLSWSKDGRYVYFNRDVHKAPGARYIPHYYELATGKIEALWPNLPDSVPQFPALDTQNPIDFRGIVQDSAATSNTN